MFHVNLVNEYIVVTKGCLQRPINRDTLLIEMDIIMPFYEVPDIYNANLTNKKSNISKCSNIQNVAIYI